MNDLIRISDDGKVTARELYEFLQLDSTHFIRWFKNNIIDNQFAAEGTDYKVFAINGENPKGGRPGQDADLSIDFAKKLCMVSKSERGEQARNYFIEVEKRFKSAAANQIQQLPQPQIWQSTALKLNTHIIDAYETAKLISDKFGVDIGIAMIAGLDAVEKNFGVDLKPITKCLPVTTTLIDYFNEEVNTVTPDKIQRVLEIIRNTESIGTVSNGYIYIESSEFTQLMIKMGYDRRLILKKMFAMGLLRIGMDGAKRYTIKKRMNGCILSCVAIKWR